MQFSIREARQKLSHLLNAVEQGEEVEITRRGRVVARLAPPREQPDDRSAPALRAAQRNTLRAGLPKARTSATDLSRQDRDERG